MIMEKIITLRKKQGWSQEELAEKMNVSRQAVSRWENGTALPDALNVLQLSKLFHVTTDFLLNDDYKSDTDIPVVQMVKQKSDDLITKKKKFHLIAAVSFTIATICAVEGVITSTSNMQLLLSCFLLALCAANAMVQYFLYFKNYKK
ncbi:MAG: helix-turn-helix domain-containing protein [Clostridia bacterium]|nr:helix-turn-helix domain-containing protein [Clostridia bacterium]